ncbi:helix-turn-helix transcriptional regulator [Roseococcus sp. SDR]|uniref:AraC family transcriptional regulator n=1 Tax=Roseococcus sp. SDR TaxID=2835532 RepID=UPI001BCB2F4E|nr:helix-turn-helix transcriptional regulator [Roseococcus sp. SDR]MBS7791499.1 helix-turn-helix transcriptional regulator [Roseococcus sp. SDR]MBV1846813.1 helix-turn-helix transcriptional regulator [Roseococcus sp. SDR]
MSLIGQNLRTIAHEKVDRPLAAFARDYAEGEATGWHAHARAQLLYATQGVMRVATPGAGFVVPPGRALWVPAAMEHEVRTEGRVAMRALFFRADAARVGEAAPAVLGVSSLLRELILAACAEPLEWDEAGRGGHLAALIAEEVARAPRLPFGVPALRDARLRRLAEALAASPASDLSLEEWAARCGASARTLARLFQAETGMGFARWRQALRLTEAAALLAQGATPAQAAASVGYASAPAFGAAFRAAFGITPGEAR